MQPATGARDTEVLITAERVRLLYAGFKTTVIANIAIGALVCAVLWEVNQPADIALWAGVLTLLTLARFMLARRYQGAADTAQQTQTALRSYVVGALLSGITWGALALLLYPSDSVAHQFFIPFTLAGMTAGAMTVMAPASAAFASFLLPAMLPSVTRFLADGDTLHVSAGLMLAVYTVVLLHTSRRLETSVTQSLRLGYQNLSLAENLRSEASERSQAQAALRDSEARYRSVVEDQTSLICRFRPDLTVTFANRALSGFLERPLERLVGQPATLLFPESTHGEVADHLTRLTPQAPVGEMEFEIQTPQSRSAWIHCVHHGIFDKHGKLTEVQAVGHDITAHKRTQQELLLAKQQAEEANRAKSQFLSRMSHELRTPLNSILGFGQLLENKKSLSSRDSECVRQIMQSGWHLLDVISDLLDLTKIEANKIEVFPESVDVHALVLDTVDACEPMAAKRAITFSHNLAACQGRYVWADPVRLKQVLLNLLSNAVKYNREGGSVKLGCEEMNGGVLRFNVTDTGSGISEADIPTLFEPFNRLYLRTHALEGTGIGLTIAKQLTELMGGRIGVRSELGTGSTFWMELQESKAPPHTIAIGQAAELPAESLTSEQTVLYIEDSPSHTQLVEEIFKGTPDIRLITAHTPKLGLELAYAHRPTLILLDICLPGMDGFDVLRELRNDARTRHTPVIAVSANATEQDLERARRAGFAHYLTKPIKVVEFRTAIANLLNSNSVH